MKERQMNIDYLRITACIMVICIHVSSQNFYTKDVTGLAWNVFNFYDCLVRSAVPLFFMISGQLFLSKKEIDIGHLFKKNIWKIIMIYCIWVVFYALYTIMTHDLDFTFHNIIHYIAKPKYHLWYLPVLIGIYFLMPILWSLVRYKDGKYLKYAVVMFFIFCICKNTILEIPNLPKSIGVILKRFSYPLADNSGYFLLGYLLSKYHDKFLYLKTRYLILLFFLNVFLCTFLNMRYALLMSQSTVLLMDTQTLFVFFEAVLLFIIFSKIKTSTHLEKFKSIVLRLSRYTLFTYLFHIFVLETLNTYLHISTLSMNPFIAVPFLTMLVFVICIATAYIMDHIPFVRKWIM